MSLSQSSVMKLYTTVIEDVINGVRDSFLDEGVDEQVLQELKQVWEAKLHASKAVEATPDPVEAQPPPIVANNQKAMALKHANGNRTGAVKKEPTVIHHQQQQHQQFPQSQQMNLPRPVQQPKPVSQAICNQAAPLQTVVGIDPSKMVPIQITLPAQAGVENATPRVLTIQVPASALQGNQLHQVLTGPVITATMSLPQNLASSLLQQHVNSALQGHATLMKGAKPMTQLDGPDDSSDDDVSDGSDENIDGASDDDNEKDDDDLDEAEGGAEEEPLNSADDVSDDDPTDMFDTDNVVVCQYDKITRSRNKWKFYLKDGIMNLNGKDLVFQRSTGDAEW